jgi:hypothetical protein
MSLKEQTIQEINQLSQANISIIYNIILSLKGSGMACEKKILFPYMDARKILSKCNISLSQDIIDQREDRI